MFRVAEHVVWRLPLGLGDWMDWIERLFSHERHQPKSRRHDSLAVPHHSNQYRN